MKTGQAAKRLNVDRTTIGNWINHPLLVKFFSAEARLEAGNTQREISPADFDVLSTIRQLRNEGIEEWEQIASHLESGERYTTYPEGGHVLDVKHVTLSQAEQSAKAAATLAERDSALARVEELESEIERVKIEYESKLERNDKQWREEMSRVDQRHREEMNLLWERISSLNQQIGRLQGKYEDGE